MATTGYEDIEKLTSQKQQMLDESLQKQNEIVNKQTQMQVDSLERQKADIERNAIQQNKAIYQDYKKASNPYGQQAETLASQGLGGSGYAETTQARLYNTYQNNITATLNTSNQLKADVDFQIQQARQTGDITLAQNSLELYMQKMQLLSEEYELRNNREQFLYQKQQDALAQKNWQTEFNYQKSRDKITDSQWQKSYNYQVSRDKVSDKQWQTTFNYQKSRDKVSDSQWQKEYELSKKAKASSSRRSSRSSSSKSSSSSTSSINIDDGNKTTSTKTTTKKSTSTTKTKDTSQKAKELATTISTGLAKAKNALNSSGVSAMVNGNLTDKGYETVLESARNTIYKAYKNKEISEEEAENLYNKFGL